ncbi:hypothetical protein PAPYR_49 [Paratrimastix pyriformis]|uniref:Uncharacterized protein n=1 Tax=Paratrimastix pyriformis TaxID=342808 RepID=A0ABQ8UUR3_9EUKA|nr:hypothetical protein PAPYR_49 [Paratrimastix pyriformis]
MSTQQPMRPQCSMDSTTPGEGNLINLDEDIIDADDVFPERLQPIPAVSTPRASLAAVARSAPPANPTRATASGISSPPEVVDLDEDDPILDDDLSDPTDGPATVQNPGPTGPPPGPVWDACSSQGAGRVTSAVQLGSPSDRHSAAAATDVEGGSLDLADEAARPTSEVSPLTPDDDEEEAPGPPPPLADSLEEGIVLLVSQSQGQQAPSSSVHVAQGAAAAPQPDIDEDATQDEEEPPPDQDGGLEPPLPHGLEPLPRGLEPPSPEPERPIPPASDRPPAQMAVTPQHPQPQPRSRPPVLLDDDDTTEEEQPDQPAPPGHRPPLSAAPPRTPPPLVSVGRPTRPPVTRTPAPVPAPRAVILDDDDDDDQPKGRPAQTAAVPFSAPPTVPARRLPVPMHPAVGRPPPLLGSFPCPAAFVRQTTTTAAAAPLHPQPPPGPPDTHNPLLSAESMGAHAPALAKAVMTLTDLQASRPVLFDFLNQFKKKSPAERRDLPQIGARHVTTTSLHRVAPTPTCDGTPPTGWAEVRKRMREAGADEPATAARGDDGAAAGAKPKGTARRGRPRTSAEEDDAGGADRDGDPKSTGNVAREDLIQAGYAIRGLTVGHQLGAFLDVVRAGLIQGVHPPKELPDTSVGKPDKGDGGRVVESALLACPEVVEAHPWRHAIVVVGRSSSKQQQTGDYLMGVCSEGLDKFDSFLDGFRFSVSSMPIGDQGIGAEDHALCPSATFLNFSACITTFRLGIVKYDSPNLIE